LVQQLNYPLQIVAAETLRAADGLALSSRNGYLSEQERQQAPRLYRLLQALAAQLESGNRDFAELEQGVRTELESLGWRVDYIAVRDAGTLQAPLAGTNAFVVLGAAWLGRTRLIDNIEVFLGD